MGFVGNYAPCGLSPQTDGMPVILEKVPRLAAKDYTFDQMCIRDSDYAVALRAVNTSDFMTAECSEIPYEVLFRVTSRIINEVKGVNRVMYDLTSKPPGTIEFE